MCTFAEFCVVRHRTVAGRVLDVGAKDGAVEFHGLPIAHDNLHIEWKCTCADYFECLREYIRINKQRLCILYLRATSSVHQVHSFCCSCALVEQRRTGDIHLRQVSDHRLEIEQALKATLRNLCLVRCVLRVPTWILDQIPENH